MGRVAVEVLAPAVVDRGRAWVGVASRELHIAQRNTRVLITGGTGGLGLAMAHALAQAGARVVVVVVVTSRHRERAQATAAELGAGASGVELDVRDDSLVSAAIDRVYGMLDGVDVLVNNAGIGMRTVNPRFMTEPQPSWEVRLS